MRNARLKVQNQIYQAKQRFIYTRYGGQAGARQSKTNGVAQARHKIIWLIASNDRMVHNLAGIIFLEKQIILSGSFHPRCQLSNVADKLFPLSASYRFSSPNPHYLTYTEITPDLHFWSSSNDYHYIPRKPKKSLHHTCKKISGNPKRRPKP